MQGITPLKLLRLILRQICDPDPITLVYMCMHSKQHLTFYYTASDGFPRSCSAYFSSEQFCYTISQTGVWWTQILRLQGLAMMLTWQSVSISIYQLHGKNLWTPEFAFDHEWTLLSMHEVSKFAGCVQLELTVQVILALYHTYLFVWSWEVMGSWDQEITETWIALYFFIASS